MGFILILSSVLRILKIYLLLFISSMNVHAFCFPQTVVLCISNLILKRKMIDTHLLSSFSLMSMFILFVWLAFVFVVFVAVVFVLFCLLFFICLFYPAVHLKWVLKCRSDLDT